MKDFIKNFEETIFPNSARKNGKQKLTDTMQIMEVSWVFLKGQVLFLENEFQKKKVEKSVDSK